MVQLYIPNSPKAVETLCRLGYERAKRMELNQSERNLSKHNASFIRFLTITKRWKFTNRQPHPHQIVTVDQIFMLELIPTQEGQSQLIHSMRKDNDNRISKNASVQPGQN